MPNVVCPTCGTTLAVTDAMLGGEVQCGQCQQVFRTTSAPPPKKATARRDDEYDEDDDRPARRRRYEEDDDDRPTRRRARRDDDGYDDRPRRRRRRYEEDDEDDREAGGNGMAVTGMILGIVAVTAEVPAMMLTAFGSVFCCGLGGVFTWPAHILGVALGVTGLILGILGMKKREGKGMAVAGVATSIAALVLALISIILIAAGYSAWQRAMNNGPLFLPPPNNPPPVRRW